jgi:transposase
VEFLPDGGQDSARESGETMKKRARRNHSPAFKAKVALAAIRAIERLLSYLRQFDVRPNQITIWKHQLVEFAAEVFERGARGKASAPAVDIKTLYTKIGELTLESDFLKTALGEAGLPSARLARGVRLPRVLSTFLGTSYVHIVKKGSGRPRNN